MQLRPETLEQLLVALLAEGHILVEDYPGVGKTALARALARSIDASSRACSAPPTCCRRTSSAPTSTTSASTGSSSGPGPVFANVVLVDEINRASPKTQSGLLECMQERRVTVDVQTHELARPFLVLATQNPIEYEGTYPLPEAQVDRFMVRISLGYPSPGAEAGMLADHEAGDRVLGPATGRDRRRCARRPGRGDPGPGVRGAARLRRPAAVAHPRGSAASTSARARGPG